ncbi:MAG: sterol desaturase family protein [Acidobacteriota bacterium]|nr:sterol desaturase family protein [Blastocatellia bacterium]MDW8411661.1 sterol desaturase family protein [Acidobacteriota bacterium]
MKKDITRDWKQFIPVYFFGSIVVFISWAAWFSQSISLLDAVVLIICGFLSWSFVEYCLHRFIFHYDAKSELGKKFVYYQHLQHHEYPRQLDRLFAKLSTSTPVSALYLLVAYSLLGSWASAGCLYIGLVIGYFLYEFLHYQAHHMSPKLGILRYLKKYHLLHHHSRSNLRYGVTSPLLDILFGTYAPLPVKSVLTNKLNPVASKVARKVENQVDRLVEQVSESTTRVTKATEAIAEKASSTLLPKSAKTSST